MRTLQKLLKHPEFSAVLFIGCTALFGWPFISFAGPSHPGAMFWYLFIVWGIVIVLLFFIAGAQGDPGNDSGSED